MALFGSKKTANEADNKDKKEEKKEAVKADKASISKDSDNKSKKDAPSMKDLYNGEAKAKTAKTASGKASKASVKSADLSNASKVLLKPVITEKATDLSAYNKYVFMVSKSANKISVSNAVKAVYGVRPTDVNILNIKGKKVTRGRIKGQRKDWRKAIVTLAKGQSINIYEGV